MSKKNDLRAFRTTINVLECPKNINNYPRVFKNDLRVFRTTRNLLKWLKNIYNYPRVIKNDLTALRTTRNLLKIPKNITQDISKTTLEILEQPEMF